MYVTNKKHNICYSKPYYHLVISNSSHHHNTGQKIENSSFFITLIFLGSNITKCSASAHTFMFFSFGILTQSYHASIALAAFLLYFSMYSLASSIFAFLSMIADTIFLLHSSKPYSEYGIICSFFISSSLFLRSISQERNLFSISVYCLLYISLIFFHSTLALVASA